MVGAGGSQRASAGELQGGVIFAPVGTFSVFRWGRAASLPCAACMYLPGIAARNAHDARRSAPQRLPPCKLPEHARPRDRATAVTDF